VTFDFADSASDDEAPAPTMSGTSKDIARDWLAQVRGNLRAQGRGGDQPAAGGPNISDDDSSSEEDRDRPVVAVSQRTLEMAKRWLAKIRPAAAAPRRMPTQVQEICARFSRFKFFVRGLLH